jgi:hypothetical protein
LKVNRLRGKRKLGSGVIRYQKSDIRKQEAANSNPRSAIRRQEKRDGNTEVTENGAQRAQREERKKKKQIPPLRGPARHNSARKKESGRSGPFGFAQGRRDDKCVEAGEQQPAISDQEERKRLTTEETEGPQRTQRRKKQE